MAIPATTFDIEVLYLLNTYSRSSYTLDMLIGFLSGNNLVKGGVLMAIFWWIWFREADNSAIRSRLASTLAACILAIGIARLLVVSLPHRLRPIHDEGLAFLPPFGVDRSVLDGWSSFPSDHAVLFYALATGLLFASRKAGSIALIYTTLVIALPRIYLGLHYPTDIIAGALLGTILSLGLQHPFALRVVGQPIQLWSTRRPAVFYAFLFLLSYQIADIFNNARSFLKLAEVLVKG